MQRTIFKCIFLLFTLIGFQHPVWAQEKVPERVYHFHDSTMLNTNARNIPNEVVEAYLDDNAFDYRFGYEKTISLWEQFKRWLVKLISRLFGNVEMSFPVEWLLYIFCAAMIIFAVLKLTGVSISGLFRRNESAPNVDMRLVMEEDIHAINFEEEIARAQQSQDYRKAVRLQYIWTLKRLVDANYLDWQPGKTNTDYQRELQDKDVLYDFRSLSIYYEYAWYGEFSVDKQLYETVNHLSRQIGKQLGVSV